MKRLSPQAKDLCEKLPNKDKIPHSPAVGGRMKRTEKADSYKGWFRKNKSAGLFRGKQPVFPSGD